jgi:site-specific DNA-methyltransferase (adenine-specific)
VPRASASGPGWSILERDAAEALASVEEDSVDLCYLDPPFGTGRRFESSAGGFDDHAASAEEFGALIRPWIREIHRVLAPHGAVLLHADWRHSHRLRLWLEEVFGEGAFVNHLVWRYGLGGSSPRRFARKHDDILFFAKGPAYYFDAPRVPATSVRMRGRSKKATDVLDIPSINNMSHERCGWPTQKPLALLRMLVQACCPPGGVVLDPCCGSGTSLVAAIESGRSAIGFDLDAAAVKLAASRLDSIAPLLAEAG